MPQSYPLHRSARHPTFVGDVLPWLVIGGVLLTNLILMWRIATGRG